MGNRMPQRYAQWKIASMYIRAGLDRESARRNEAVRPVREEDPEKHVMHCEFCRVTAEAAETLSRIRAAGGRIVCVGTTSVRTLESHVSEDGLIQAGAGDTAIFIHPGVPLRATDALITNFHLPQSTLLMLVSALMGREETLRVYEEAVRERYRFFSFGDAMMID
jgi:S-adenosylmethionine:tRNA ribosyltransferase-isomerase